MGAARFISGTGLLTMQSHLDSQLHEILTGKNGSGKTSLLDAMAAFLNTITESKDLSSAIKFLSMSQTKLRSAMQLHDALESKLNEIREDIAHWETSIEKLAGGVMLEMNAEQSDIRAAFKDGKFIVAYYKADRIFKANVPKHIEKVTLENNYKIYDVPGENLINYLLDLKMTQALAISHGKPEKAEVLKGWFDNFEKLLREVFENDSLRLDFDEDTFAFKLRMNGREPFDFNTLSSGYAAVLDVVVDLILRMEKQTGRKSPTHLLF